MKTIPGKTIQQQILEVLRMRLADLPEGARFQTEHELCAEFKVARTTMTRVMVKLVEEGLLKRVPCKGSFVQKPKAPDVPITFLLPCAGYISDTVQFPHSLHTRQILQGVSQVAFKHNCRVQTVPVSPTNDRHDIDLRQLDFVDSTSKVVVTNPWYCDLFHLLKERGCKVVNIDNQTYYSKLYADYFKNWYVLTIDRIKAVEVAVKFLSDRGCRKIALARCDLNEKDHPVLSGYKSGLAKCGLRYSAWKDLSNTPNRTVGKVIADFYQKNNFDALLLDPYQVFMLRTQKSLNYCLGLPDSVKIMADDEIGYNHRAFPSLSSLDFQYENVGRAAAQYLLQEDFIPGNEVFHAKIIERESTMCETEQLALLTT